MRKLLSATLAIVLLGSLSNVSPAQGTAGVDKPVVTISFAGYNALRGQVDIVGKLIGNPDLSKGLETFLMMATQGKGLAMLDKTKPWGAVISATGTERAPEQLLWHGFVPVTDLKQLMSLAPNPATHQPFVPDADGVYVVNDGRGVPGFIVAKGAWGHVVSRRDMIKSLAADPAVLLGDLPKQYTLACRVSLQNLPRGLRESLGTQAQTLARLAINPGLEDDDEVAERLAVIEEPIKKALGAIDELDELLVGLKIDQTSNSAQLDYRLTAVAGSATAKKFAQVKAATTAMAGFLLPDAALTANWAVTLDDASVAAARKSLAAFGAATGKELDGSDELNKDQIQVAKQLLLDAIAVADKTLQGKKTDCGLALVLKPRATTLLFGSLIVDGDKLDNVFKRLVAEIGKDDPDTAKLVKLDADSQDGVHFHVATIPVTSPELTVVVGAKVEAVLGIGPDRLYVAVGQDALKQLKDAIAKSKAAAGKEIPPLRISLAAAPVAKFVAELQKTTGDNGDAEAKAMVANIASTLEKTAGGKDHVTLTVTPVTNGLSARLEVEEGLLKLGGGLMGPIGPGGMPPGGMPPGGMPPGGMTQPAPAR